MKKSFDFKFFNTLTLITISGVLIFVLYFSIWTVFSLKTDYNLRQFFPKNSALLKEDEKIDHHFNLHNKSNLHLIIEQKNANLWTNSQSMSSLRKLTKELEKLSGIKKVHSITNLHGAFEAGFDLYVGNLFSEVPIKYWEDVIQTNNFIVPHFLSVDQKKSLITIELLNDSSELLLSVKEKIQKLQSQKFSQMNLDFAGVPILQKEVGLLLNQELIFSAQTSFFVIFLFLLLFFRTWHGVALVMFSVLFNNLVCGAMLAYFNIPFDVLLSTLPVLISLNTLTLALQILARMNSSLNYISSVGHFEKSVNVSNIFKKYFLENFLASGTTAIGFLMLYVSDIQMIQEYGLITSVFILCSWLITHLVFYVTLSVSPVVRMRKFFDRGTIWGSTILNHAKFNITVGGGIVVAAIIAFQFLNWNGRLLDDLPKNNLARIQTERVDQNFGGLIPISVVIDGASKTMWSEHRWLTQLNNFTIELKKIEIVGSAIAASDFVKRSTSSGVRLPASKAEAQESFFLHSLARVDPTSKYINSQTGQTRIEVKLHDFSSDKIWADLKKIEDLVLKFFPGMKYSISGPGTTIHSIFEDTSKDLIFSFWQALALIGVLLIFVFWSWKWALVACLPNLLPPLALLIFLAVTQTPIKPSVAIMFSIAIGIAFSSTIYFLLKLKKLTKSYNLKNYLPLKRTLSQELIPCALSTLISICAFSIFLFSNFGMNQMFGMTLIVALLTAAFGDLVFLPSFIHKYPHFLLGKIKK